MHHPLTRSAFLEGILRISLYYWKLFLVSTQGMLHHPNVLWINTLKALSRTRLLKAPAGKAGNGHRSTVNRSRKAGPTAPARRDRPPAKYRIAVLKEALDHPSLDPEIRAKITEFIAELRLQGHRVEEISFDLLDYIVPAYYILTTAEASSNLSRFDGVRYGHRTTDPEAGFPEFYLKSRSEGFGKEVKRRILLGTFVLSAGYYEAYFSKAQKVRKILTERTKLIFNEFDLILTPTVPTTAFKAGEKSADPVAMYLADLYTVYANLVGIPGISLPLFTHTNGMPFGIQVMTNRFRELSLLQFSNELMQQYKSYEIPTL
jgi:aspartyl-tRNA(Asn)/glutamyl-tRNA(Gln) amidotransferase subunit A